MIEAQSLTKRYGSKVAVNELSIQVRPGQITGFLGPNGAGKSTTMRMILGLDRPSGGRVTVNGKEYQSSPPRCGRSGRCWTAAPCTPVVGPTTTCCSLPEAVGFR